MENNDYFESTIKTTREDKQFKKDLLNVFGNFFNTSLDCIEKQNTELERLEKEKQKFISFLEEKIKEIEEKIKENLDRTDYLEYLNKKIAFQEALDFVNKEGK